MWSMSTKSISTKAAFKRISAHWNHVVTTAILNLQGKTKRGRLKIAWDWAELDDDGVNEEN